MNPVLLALVGLVAVGHQAARLLAPASRRRREARAVRSLLLDEINEGKRSFDDPGVRDLLAWCAARA